MFASFVLAALLQSVAPISPPEAPPKSPPSVKPSKPDLSRAATTRNERRWASAIQAGYPTWAAVLAQEGTAGVNIAVTPEGTVASCTLVQSTGHAILDEAACAGMTRFARFNPALDASGNPVQGRYSTRITYVTGFSSIQRLPSALPRNQDRWERRVRRNLSDEAQGLGWSGEINYTLGVNYNGRATSCFITQSSGHRTIDLEFCEQLEARARFEPIESQFESNIAKAQWSGTIAIGDN